MTIYHSYTPRPPLSAFVDTFWLYENPMPLHTRERVLPQGSMQLIINLREDLMRVYDRQDCCQSFRGCLINGAYSEFSVIDTTNLVSVLGVSFKPGGAFPFLKLPAGELHNMDVALETLWGTAAADLRDELLAASTVEARFLILERAFSLRLARALTMHPAVSFALREFQHVPHIYTIADVTERISLSSRRFIEVFRNEVGLTPKLFCCVRRFQQVLHLIRSGQQIDWASIALTCGYFDQAHCIHDFQSFAGLTPTAYIALQGEYRNHIPLNN